MIFTFSNIFVDNKIITISLFTDPFSVANKTLIYLCINICIIISAAIVIITVAVSMINFIDN